jgi:quercetin dioxygenase-like cupin family protein
LQVLGPYLGKTAGRLYNSRGRAEIPLFHDPEKDLTMSVRPSRLAPKEPIPAGTGTVRQVLIGPDEGPNFALRKFTMDPGGGMPLHTNTVEHEQYVLRGRARIVIGEDVVEVEEGDVVFIPGGMPHSYEALGDGPFEFLCIVPNLPDETTVLAASAGDEEESQATLEAALEDELGC